MSNPIPRIDPELKALIPPLSQEEYTQLEHNILAYKKCRDAIVVWSNTIVDGHNRFRICAEHGIPFEIKEMSFNSRDEAKLWILDNQLGRRNLTDAMRIELALSKAELLRLQAKENLRRAGGDKSSYKRAGAPLSTVAEQHDDPINVRKAVADETGVGEATVHRYAQISKHASPELLGSVKNGDMKINTAYRLLDKQILKQLKNADKLIHYIEDNYPLEGDDATNQQVKAILESALAHLRCLKEDAEAPNHKEAQHA